MKTYLTKNGLLVVRDDAAFFTNNSGEFRRLASQDEVEYLTDVMNIQISLFYAEGWHSKFLENRLNTSIPLWQFLWSVRSSDYSSYKPETCNNGGDYAFHSTEYFFARCVDSKWEIKSLTLKTTSAGFSYDELNGRFQNNCMGLVSLLGVKNECFSKSNYGSIVTLPWKMCIYTQTMDGHNEDMIIDRLLESNYTVEDAINAQGYYIPEANSDKEEGFLPLDEAELQRRQMIADYLGITDKPTRGSGRNKRI